MMNKGQDQPRVVGGMVSGIKNLIELTIHDG